MYTKTLYILLLTILAHQVTTYTQSTTCTGTENDISTRMYGGCILKTAQETAPANTKSLNANPVSIATGSCITAATKYQNIYGLLNVGSINGQTVSDTEMCWIGKAFQEMFVATSGETNCDAFNQHLILQKAYEYRSANATFKTTKATGFEKFTANYSSCDVITIGGSSQNTANKQISEVVEHLLHAISDTGFAQAMPKYFAHKNSYLACAKDEAVKNGTFKTTDYNQVTNAETKERIIIQEYFYWLVTTAWGFQTTYGENSPNEWPYRTWADLKACNRNPLGVDLYENVISKIITQPSTATLTSLGKMKQGGTPDASPCPLTAGTTPTNCCCTCSKGCVVDDTPSGTAATCKKTSCATQKAFTWVNSCSTVKHTSCPNVKAAGIIGFALQMLLVVYMIFGAY